MTREHSADARGQNREVFRPAVSSTRYRFAIDNDTFDVVIRIAVFAGRCLLAALNFELT